MDEGLERIQVTGFCSLADITLKPGRLTVLIGVNGSGKSNLLRALKMVPLMRTGSLQRFVGESGGASALLHYGPKRTQAMTVKLDFVQQQSRRNRYFARLGFAAGDRLLYLDESVGYQANAEAQMQMTTLGAGHWESALRDMKGVDLTAKNANYWLSQLTFFHFHDTSVTSALRTQARLADDRYLRSDGSNLPAFLARLEQSEHDAEHKAWRRINLLVQRIAPSVKALCPAELPNGGVRLDWIDGRGERFGVQHLSDGTLRAIALVTALAQPTELLPRFMCVDEPELGLHPAAIAILAELARSVCRHTQVLFATQSTTFLDQFEPEEVVVVEQKEGATVLTRHDAATLAAWLDEYSLAEIFDKGLLGGRP